MSFVSPDDDRRPGYVRDSDEAEQERALRAFVGEQHEWSERALRIYLDLVRRSEAARDRKP